MFLNKEFLAFFEKSKEQKLDIVVASVTQTLGSTYAKAGNMIVVNSNEKFIGVLGSPYLHKKILDESKGIFKNRDIRVFDFIPKDESSGHGSSKFFLQGFFYDDNYGALEESLENYGKTLIRSTIDGSFSFCDKKFRAILKDENFYQTIEKPFSLLIFGSGAHVKPLISIANLLGWKTTIIDLSIKKGYVDEADELIELESLENILSIDLNSYNASVILSHSPKTDDTYLRTLINSNINYIGMMGNKKNMKRLTEFFSLQNDDRFYAPIGLDIGGNTHQSIALSICAQIEAKKNGKI